MKLDSISWHVSNLNILHTTCRGQCNYLTARTILQIYVQLICVADPLIKRIFSSCLYIRQLTHNEFFIYFMIYNFKGLKAELAHYRISVIVKLNFIFHRFARPFTLRWLTVSIKLHLTELDVRCG